MGTAQSRRIRAVHGRVLSTCRVAPLAAEKWNWNFENFEKNEKIAIFATRFMCFELKFNFKFFFGIFLI